MLSAFCNGMQSDQRVKTTEEHDKNHAMKEKKGQPEWHD